MAPKLVLAPSLVPDYAPETSGPVFYLSWPGWELFLKRVMKLDPGALQPILLPDDRDAESDYRVIADLAGRVGRGEMPALWPEEAGENSPALVEALRRWGRDSAPATVGGLWDDRLFLALWSHADYQAREAARLLARAAESERRMWAALKGAEDFAAEAPPAPSAPEAAPAFPEAVMARAWRAWRNLFNQSQGLPAGSPLEPAAWQTLRQGTLERS